MGKLLNVRRISCGVSMSLLLINTSDHSDDQQDHQDNKILMQCLENLLLVSEDPQNFVHTGPYLT